MRSETHFGNAEAVGTKRLGKSRSQQGSRSY